MQSCWPQVLARLESEFTAQELQTWVRPLQAEESEGALQLLAPNPFVVDSVRERFLPRIAELARHFAGQPELVVRVEVGNSARAARVEAPASRPGPAPASPQRSEPEYPSALDPSYQFENFVEGKSNQLGRAAAMQVAANPGKAYNPLLLYGGTGLGKTHLMHAAGNAIRAANPGLRVLYLRSEQFTNEMVKALQQRSMESFKQRFRQIDALLIDDIQFFAGKNTTQEEFFHTFNALFDGKQQIILTCDRYPKEVENLEPRLKSRLGWGLSVAIEPPDFETRAAILLSKAHSRGIALPDSVAMLIAKRMRSNVRDLEGALNTLAARANFMARPITEDFAQETLRDLLHAQQQAISISNIVKVVADYHQLRVADLLGKRRTQSLARARQMAMALARELTEHSLPEIGNEFGGRDHTTVLHACKVVRGLLETDGKIREDWDKLIRKLTE
ncbi:chromosomal replication initiator protein DnaA [Pseudomarimonas salicorniae]|uniref:Chromosomal replication initiator protein DnaA n=1 Tax=Pseudomarimonas salicorniae TaxID=2933270 RepID=A0ABT0GEK2_9GAMM|nr:chromosomal replication initiator protein DnaA [Lysobacter sp. CAU 1642]MCK7592452.1 chromosomal replication initiator protein DnaA [Lysobacter sp. CAU 1642]